MRLTPRPLAASMGVSKPTRNSPLPSLGGNDSISGSRVPNLVDDIQFLSEDPDLRGLRELPTRCPLKHFDARRFRFPNVKDLDITTIPEGFMNIFPSISAIASTSDTGWSMLESRVYKLREMRKGSVVKLECVRSVSFTFCGFS